MEKTYTYEVEEHDKPSESLSIKQKASRKSAILSTVSASAIVL